MKANCPGNIYDFISSASIFTGNGASYEEGFMVPEVVV